MILRNLSLYMTLLLTNLLERIEVSFVVDILVFFLKIMMYLWTYIFFSHVQRVVIGMTDRLVSIELDNTLLFEYIYLSTNPSISRLVYSTHKKT